MHGVTFGDIDRALRVACVAIGTEHLVAFDGGAVGDVVETGQHAAQRIGQVEEGLAGVIQRTEQPASQAVVVKVTFMTTSVEVGMPTGCAPISLTNTGIITSEHLPSFFDGLS